MKREKDNLSEIGQRIHNLRKSLKISQEELALKCGYNSRSSIAKIEKGETDLTQTKLKAFACVFNTTYDYLLFGEEEKKVTLDDVDKFLLEAIQKLDPIEKLQLYGYMKEKGFVKNES